MQEVGEKRVVGVGNPPHPGDIIKYSFSSGIFAGVEGGKWYVANGYGRSSLVKNVGVTIFCPGGPGHDDGAPASSE